MDFPRISIVTPSFNAQEFIEETIVSVLDQDYPNLQYIIIDGGSTDKTPHIIRKYERYLDFWLSEPDKGQSHAISKGLARCNGEVFNWLNADDAYTPNALSIVGEYFKDPSLNVLAGRSRIFGMGQDRISSGTDIYPGNLERTIGRARIDQPETFFRLQHIRSIGGVNPTLHYLMDRELWMRYLLTYGLSGICKAEDILVNFRLHDSSKSVSKKDGFLSEEGLLFDLLTSDTYQGLCNSLSPNSGPKILCEWILHQYEISYALRDWRQMSKRRNQLVGWKIGFQATKVIAVLELKRLLGRCLMAF